MPGSMLEAGQKSEYNTLCSVQGVQNQDERERCKCSSYRTTHPEKSEPPPTSLQSSLPACLSLLLVIPMQTELPRTVTRRHTGDTHPREAKLGSWLRQTSSFLRQIRLGRPEVSLSLGILLSQEVTESWVVVLFICMPQQRKQGWIYENIFMRKELCFMFYNISSAQCIHTSYAHNVSSAHGPLPALRFRHIFFLLSKDMVTLE